MSQNGRNHSIMFTPDDQSIFHGYFKEQVLLNGLVNEFYRHSEGRSS